jgi:hypothetical protein
MPRTYENYSTELGNYSIQKLPHPNHTSNTNPINNEDNNNDTNTNTNINITNTTTKTTSHNERVNKYGSDAVRHWKYNFQSSGHTTMSKSTTLKRASVFNSTTTVGHNDDDSYDVTYHIHKQMLEEEERRAAVGLGYGSKHATHYSYKSPHGSKHVGSLSGRIVDVIGEAKQFRLDESNKLYKSQVAHSIGYGRMSKYRFSAFARPTH